MKRLILFSMVCLVSTATRAQTDSIRTETLPEIVVNSDGQIETAEKAVLLPTMTEKKHSANGFDLLNVMQTAELEVSPRTRSITTLIGWDDVAEFNIDFERDIACWWHHNMPERLTRLYEKKMSVILTPRMPMYSFITKETLPLSQARSLSFCTPGIQRLPSTPQTVA